MDRADWFSAEQRQEFFGEMQFYIKMCELEQEVRLTGRTPTMEEYWQWRMGTGAVGACTAMIEYVFRPCSTGHQLLNRYHPDTLVNAAYLLR